MLEPKDEIKLKLDVAEVLGDYIVLKPAGTGSLKALCPFHAERTPSFHVSRERQSWHCFGCDKGGDIFSFVMEIDGLTFPEALRNLAQKAGVELPEYRPRPEDHTKERLIAMHDVAAKFYSSILADAPFGEAVRAYVLKRNIPSELVTKFKIGAAPDSWDALMTCLHRNGYTDAEIVQGGLGLPRKSGSGIVDRFRNRMMIPLCDAAGNVVAFTARQLPGATDVDGPKYMNSPETPIYKKGDMLYGLHLAKVGMREKKSIIVVEGNLDVIASHKAGIENIVASSGTALTTSQLRTLARYTKCIIFALDEDAAGFAAAKRVLDLALELQKDPNAPQFEIRCLIIPEGAGKDPDEIVEKDPELWRKIAAHSEDVIEYVFTKRLRGFEDGAGAAKIEARKALVDELLPYVARLQRPDSRHLYLLRMSDATHVDIDSLQQMLAAKVAPGKGDVMKGVGGRVLGVGGASTTAPMKSVPIAIPPVPDTKIDRAAAFLFGVALKYEGFTGEILSIISEEMLTSELWKTLYNALRIVYHAAEQLPHSSAPKQTLFTRLRAWLEAQGKLRETSAVNALAIHTDELLVGLSPTEVRQEADRNITIVSQEQSRLVRSGLERDIREAELSGDDEGLQRLMRVYRDVVSRK